MLRRAGERTEREGEAMLQCPYVSSTSPYPNVRLSSLATPQYIQFIRPAPQNIPLQRNEMMDNGLTTSKALVLVAIIFVSSLLVLGFVYRLFPDLEEFYFYVTTWMANTTPAVMNIIQYTSYELVAMEWKTWAIFTALSIIVPARAPTRAGLTLAGEERQHVKLPWDLDDAKKLGLVLDRYKEKYFYEVMSAVFLVYIFLQTFAIPGSIFLSILSGFLFPFQLALLLVCCCSAIGATLCYFLSNILGKKLVKTFFPDRAAQWAVAVDKHKNHLLNYMIFLRVTPFLPNWFINMSAPVIGVPLLPFVLGTFIGVAPPSFVAIQAGQTLHTLTSTSDAWSWGSVVVLSALALLSLAPVLLKHRLREKFE